MENFINLKPKDIKVIKEEIKKVFDMVETDEPTEDEINGYMELIEFFQDVADDIKQKLYDITGYESTDEMEEAEVAPATEVLS